MHATFAYKGLLFNFMKFFFKPQNNEAPLNFDDLAFSFNIHEDIPFIFYFV